MANKMKAKVAVAANGSAPEAKSESGSIASYFKAIFKENPKLLKNRSNHELLKRWLDDHPDEKEVPARIKQNLANVKSVLRNKKRNKSGKAAQPPEAAVTAAVGVAFKKTTSTTRQLEQLEEAIDDCLTLARHTAPDTLANVIVLLRRARNAVVWQLGGDES